MVVWCCCRYWRADSETSVLIEEFWGRENVLAAFPNFWCCSDIWSGLNRISHPDWMKICGDPNGQIKLRAKQKYKVLSATVPIIVGALGTVSQRLGNTGNQRKNQDHPNYSTVKISQNTEKSPGDKRKNQDHPDHSIVKIG